MLQKILTFKDGKNSCHEFTDYIRQGIPLAVFGINDSFKCYLASNINSKVLYVVKDNISANFVVQEIKDLCDKKVVYLPPKDELLLPTRASSKESAYVRITAIENLQDADVIVTTIEAIMQTLPKKLESIMIIKDSSMDKMEFTERLIKFGYLRRDSVEDKGTFAVRGDVVDIFPINSNVPVRIDFFDDLIEGIKQFDPETRKSMGFIDSIKIIQAHECSYTGVDFSLFKSLIKTKLNGVMGEKYDKLRVVADNYLDAIESGDIDGLSPLYCLSENAGNITDYLTKDTVVVFDEGKRIGESADLIEREFTERFNSLVLDGEAFDFVEKNLIKVDSVINMLNGYREVGLQSLSTKIPFFNPLKIINPQVSGIPKYQLDFNELFTDVKNWVTSGYSIVIYTGNKERADRLAIDLTDVGVMTLRDAIPTPKVASIYSDELASGFIFHEEKTVVIGSGNLYAKPVSARKIKVKKQNFFTAPEIGDYCVHELHGIGRVLGNKRISSTEGTKDYLSIEYAGGDILYVPVEQMDILSRYLGGDKRPKLSKIGGADFEKIKRAVKDSIKKMSFDLKALYKERTETKGYPFVVEKDLEDAFSNAFIYEETLDQEICDEEIKADMQNGIIMDRLVCGDVGFGKTEVAFRAAFRAIVNGKQVAFLAPTTILTEQHYNTALERFKGFGVRIAVLNRFKSAKEQKIIVEDAKAGKIDLLIGTHRLLSKDVGFKDLGLLVLDEEQRFGVEHKEKIKLLKSNVDTITLTATPIPRTLHMSLTGIRSISVLNTPPKKRLPVQTYVTEESESLIKDAILREVNRGGQAFILYNRVESIYTFATRISAILPTVKITVIHGQMEEKAMEKAIIDFYKGNSDLLISTTIIENGIDLPKANTLIVIDADKMGLSTLYQLKGRVGRSDRLAYAYFTFKKEKILSSTAFDRLNAIIEFTEMGSGIKIAMRDLEIRGAGNVLGAEQHGHMDKIGYELYSKLLREELSGVEEKQSELDIRVSAYIPENYIESNTMRMDAYKEIAEIENIQDEKEFIEQAKDIYGVLPSEVENLINIAVVKLLASKINVSLVTVKKEETSLAFKQFSAFNNKLLNVALDGFKGQVDIDMETVPKIVFRRNDGQTNDEMLKKVKNFLLQTV